MASTGEPWRLGVVAALVAVAVGLVGWPRVADALAAPRTAESALASLSSADLNEPDTAALALRAAARLGDVQRVRALAARLDRLAIHRGDEYGWGLSFPFDAYQDGSTNPASTIYTYTTAQAGLALLDAYDLTGEHRYRREAVRAGDTILSAACCWRGGAAVWYSDQAQDQQGRAFVTPNVNGLSAALFLRLGGRFTAAGHRITRELVAARQGFDWRYQYGATKLSDLLHLSFVLDGLAADPDTRPLARKAAEAALAAHFDDSLRPDVDFATLGSQGWGPPALLVALQKVGSPAAPRLAAELAERASTWPDLVKDTPRARAWYAFALAGSGN